MTLTDKNTLASNRQHVCHSEGLRKFMVTCIGNISIRIKVRSIRLLCTFCSQKMLVKRKAVSYPPNIDLHKSLGSRLIIYIIVHADTSKKSLSPGCGDENGINPSTQTCCPRTESLSIYSYVCMYHKFCNPHVLELSFMSTYEF